jgi:hypothetical protein
LNHPSEKKMLKIKELEPVPLEKVDQLFRNMLSSGMRKSVSGFSRQSRSNVLESTAWHALRLNQAQGIAISSGMRKS